MLTIQHSKKIWNKLLISLVLIFSFTSVAFAIGENYITNTFNGKGYIYDRTPPGTRSSSYALTDGSYVKDNTNNFINRCESNATNCDASLDQTTLSNGGTYYFYNETTNEYVTATFTYDVGFSDLIVYIKEPTNSTPTLTTIPNQTKDEDFTDFNITINANDADDDNLSFRVDMNDTSILNASFSAGLKTKATYVNGVPLTITPIANKFGTVELNVTVTDTSDANVSEVFTITVNSVNDKPTITSTPVTEVNQNSSYSYGLEANDSDGDALSWSVTSGTNLPSWLSLNSGTSSLYGTPTVAGVYDVNLTLSDGNATVAHNFQITVADSTSPTTDITVAVSDNGTDVETTVRFNSALTVIRTDENARNIIVGDSNITLSVDSNGTARYTVTYRGVTTKVVSSIKGTKVVVDASGNIESTSEIEKNGFIYRAIISTNVEGKTQTKFVKIDVATGQELVISNTLKSTTPYQAGNEAAIIELNSLIYIKVSTPLDATLVVE
ncbi:putative Ig domain-containing protein [bacterium]|nr:putative Ig domain-containing protein [bacterium]MBU1957351.1 putative Ig domain-containing protein [bacterium]